MNGFILLLFTVVAGPTPEGRMVYDWRPMGVIQSYEQCKKTGESLGKDIGVPDMHRMFKDVPRPFLCVPQRGKE